MKYTFNELKKTNKRAKRKRFEYDEALINI